MLVGPDGSAVGSVSGGCVEGAVYELAQQVVADGAPRLHRYGVSDDDAFEVGLTCGGILDVYVERVDRTTFPELGDVADDLAHDRPVAVATVVDHPDPSRVGRADGRASRADRRRRRLAGSLGSARVDAAVGDDALGLLATGHSGVLTYGPDGERRGEGMRVFVWAFAPAAADDRLRRDRLRRRGRADGRLPRLPRHRLRRPPGLRHRTRASRRPTRSSSPGRTSTSQAEADAGRVDSRTVLCVLTHDPKFDVPLLEVALRLPDVGYVGAMGSRRTHDDRMARLREAGLTDEELARLSSPIGLDLGARTPEETAVSIAAEIIALRWGGGGERLVDLEGRIHHGAHEAEPVG